MFLSQRHFDHSADFSYFPLSTWVFGCQIAPVVVGPPETAGFIRHLFADDACAKDLDARVQHPQRVPRFRVPIAQARWVAGYDTGEVVATSAFRLAV